jgi:hypothetical protein
MNRLQIAACCALLFSAGAVNKAQAQATVDMAKMSCEQLLSGSANAIEAVIWLSGYYNGLQKNTVLNLNQFKQNAEVVVGECRANPKTTVMKAVETLLSRK